MYIVFSWIFLRLPARSVHFWLSYSLDVYCHILVIVVGFHYDLMCRSFWRSSPYSLGAYCHIPVGSTVEDIQTLADPVTDGTGRVRSIHPTYLPTSFSIVVALFASHIHTCNCFTAFGPGQAGGPVPEETFTHSHPSWSSDILYQLPPSATIHSILFIATESVNQLPFAPLVIICILNICICWYIGTCLRCFDTVGWVLGRASGL